jgi:hypothetical protein
MKLLLRLTTYTPVITAVEQSTYLPICLLTARLSVHSSITLPTCASVILTLSPSVHPSTNQPANFHTCVPDIMHCDLLQHVIRTDTKTKCLFHAEAEYLSRSPKQKLLQYPYQFRTISLFTSYLRNNLFNCIFLFNTRLISFK